ncbi:hypothetical protein N8I77_004973 [Diaporthe amygdali]|uniref:Uncharacterized protein n=1 Tax=Phomopsis amygdali TaxID=1214568 RepID=A0AAD9SMG3_PHOAM|nr:hypothetical protein N8I77_004973 [Diaporthe amygdali]
MRSLKRFVAVVAPLFAIILTTWSLHNSFRTIDVTENLSQNRKRDPATDYFTNQFSNPAGVLSVLLLVGGDTVQKAVAQMTGGRHAVFTPVVFSFGWVSYAVSMLATAVGDAIFLPRPEHAGYIVNVGSAEKDGTEKIGSGDRRENRSWHLGRLMRDLALAVESEVDEELRDSGLLVSVYQLDPAGGARGKQLHPKKDWLWWSFAWAIPCQLAIGCVPWVLQGDWSVFLITATGNLLAILTASLPSMRNVRYRKASQSSYALTRGNGHPHVFIIRPDSYAISDPEEGGTVNVSSLPYLDELAVNIQRASITARGLSAMFAVLWVMLLIAVGGLRSGTWYLFGAGTVGMLFNILISNWPRDSAAYGLPLKKIEDFGFKTEKGGRRQRVQEVLLKLEAKYPGAGHALRPLYFTTLPNEDKDRKWNDPTVSLETAEQRLKDLPRYQDQIRSQQG